MITNPQVGQTVYVINRQRVRAGKGVVKAKITELVYTTCMGVRAVTSFYAGRSFYGTNEACAAYEDAVNEAHKIVAREKALEYSRYMDIRSRLDKAARAIG